MGGRGYGGGGSGRLHTYCYIVTTRMTCIKMGSDESHFNVSLIVRDKDCVHKPQLLKRIIIIIIIIIIINNSYKAQFFNQS